jgi:hypothetical protein
LASNLPQIGPEPDEEEVCDEKRLSEIPSNRAFRMRVRDAIYRLDQHESAESIREEHGGLVLAEAFYQRGRLNRLRFPGLNLPNEFLR